MRAHKLKCWPEPYRAMDRGDKTCEVRKADRDYRVGDYLMIREFVPADDLLTGAYIFRRITHILTGDVVPRALMDGHVVLSVEPCDKYDEATLLGQPGGFVTEKVEWIPAPPANASSE